MSGSDFLTPVYCIPKKVAHGGAGPTQAPRQMLTTAVIDILLFSFYGHPKAV